MAAKVLELRAQLDEQLSQIAILNKATEKVKVPFFKAYLVVGLGALIVLLIAIGVADDFLTDIIGTAFPAFASLKLAYSFVRISATHASFSLTLGRCHADPDPRLLTVLPPRLAARSLSGSPTGSSTHSSTASRLSLTQLVSPSSTF